MKLTEEQKKFRKSSRYCGLLAGRLIAKSGPEVEMIMRIQWAQRSAELARHAATWAFRAHPELRDEPGGTE